MCHPFQAVLIYVLTVLWTVSHTSSAA